MIKNKKTLAIVLLSFVSTICFVGSLVSAVVAGRFLYNNFSNNIKALIDGECEKIDCGCALYSVLGYENNQTNIEVINQTKKRFDEVLNNQLSKGETEVKVECLTTTKENITLMETESYDRHFDNMHIYSDTSWLYFDEDINYVYISNDFEKEIIAGTGLKNARGQTIKLSANGQSIELKIGGTYLTGTYPKDSKGKARGDGLRNIVGETILLHESKLMELNPTKAIAMFSSDSSDNGTKYELLRDVSKNNNYKFEFNINSREGSTLNEDLSLINDYVSKHKTNVGLSIIFIVLVVLLTTATIFAAHYVLKILEYKSLSEKKKTLVAAIFGALIVIVLLASLLIFKNTSFGVLSIVSIPALHSISLLLIIVPSVVTIIYYAITQKKLIKKIFGEKPNNSEFDY